MILISRRGAQGPKTLFPFHKAIKILSLHCTYSQNGTRRAELHFYLIIFLSYRRWMVCSEGRALSAVLVHDYMDTNSA